MNDDTFARSLEVSARSLASYVLYREWVIKRLQNIGPEQLEAEIHNLIVPQRAQYTEAELAQQIYRTNVWLLDEKFMTFRTVLSERRMDEVVNAIRLEDETDTDETRPDITMIFSADPDAAQKVDVVVVELKRRDLNLKESIHAATQLRQRARKIIDFCPNVQRVWYYGIVEFDDALAQSLRDDGYAPLYSHGEVYYREYTLARTADGQPIPTPVFMVSFSAVTADAAARNHTFLELLRQAFKAAANPAATAQNTDVPDAGGVAGT